MGYNVPSQFRSLCLQIKECVPSNSNDTKNIFSDLFSRNLQHLKEYSTTLYTSITMGYYIR